MENTFDLFKLINKKPFGKYNSGKGCEMLLFNDCTKDDFELQCSFIENANYALYDSFELKNNIFKTYVSDNVVHIYFCDNEKKMRVITDPNTNLFNKNPESCNSDYPVTLWQFEVDHALIDCGMCYIVRCGDGSFFVIDSAHMYSVNDDVRIIEFLKKMNGGKKPVVAGWFISHGHDDHVSKLNDIIDYHRDEVDIEAIYYNFPPSDHRDGHFWGECNHAITARFEKSLNANPDLKCITLHSGQHFYIRNLEFVVLCTHEDVYPNSNRDYNDSSVSLMMHANGSKVLFPGDSAIESDKVIVPRWGNYLNCDVVQVSHHGHTGTSTEFYRLADADCALFAITAIKFDEELPKQEPNRVAIELAKEYHIASNGTVEIPLPYKFGQTKIYPDETFEDFNGIYQLWSYEYTDEYKEKLYQDFLKRKG